MLPKWWREPQSHPDDDDDDDDDDDVGFVPRRASSFSFSRPKSLAPRPLLLIKQLFTPTLSLSVKEIDTKNRSIPLATAAAAASDPLFGRRSDESATTRQQIVFPDKRNEPSEEDTNDDAEFPTKKTLGRESNECLETRAGVKRQQ